MRDWKQQLSESLNGGRASSKNAYRWCKGDVATPIAVMERADGSLTGNFQEIDGLLQQAWLPIFQKYAKTPEPE
eukprot:956838-Karenia_brevis.AAC.1